VPGGVTRATPRAHPPTAIERAGTTFDCGAVPTGAAASGDAVAVGFGDGALRLFRPGVAPLVVQVHQGAILSLAAAPGGAVLTGGDDGRLCYVSPAGEARKLASFGSKWVDHVAAHRNGAYACSVGRVAHVHDGETGRAHQLEHPSTVGGLAFDPRGERLAVAHYGGVTVWTRERRGLKASGLKWAGSHVGVAWSPDGKTVVSAMQENALHGWRLRDRADMRMSGYPARVKSWAWVGARPFLATSGADAAVLWPFDGRDGPMGRPPMLVCPGGPTQVTAVAALPGVEAVLAGFGDGRVLLGEIDDRIEPRLVKSLGNEAITVLAVTPRAGWLLAGEEDGRVLWTPLAGPA